MKRFLVLPLVIVSLSMSIEMPVNQGKPNDETIIHEPKTGDQENELTIYKRPDFMVKWNDQFLEPETDSEGKN